MPVAHSELTRSQKVRFYAANVALRGIIGGIGLIPYRLRVPAMGALVSALAPLAELFGYATAIRSLTKGRASYTLEPHFFDIVPQEIQKDLVNW